MKRQKDISSRVVHVRLDVSLLKEIDMWAAADDRSRAHMIQSLLRRGLAAQGAGLEKLDLRKDQP